MRTALALSLLASLIALGSADSATPLPRSACVMLDYETRGNLARGPWAAAWGVYLDRAVPYGFSGGMLVVEGGEVVLRGSYGLADREREVPVTPQSVFYIGSVTKQFTAAAVMRLVDLGSLTADDRLEKFFPEVPHDRKDVTVHHLLTHTSGLQSNIGELYGVPVGRDEHVAELFAAPLAADPGVEYIYSNAGYSLLAAIVEIASGTTFERFVHDHLFVPAGMSRTGYVLPAWSRDEIARGYDGEIDHGIPLDRESWTEEGPTWRIQGAGGMMSTLDDLHRWHEALGGDTVLSAAVRERMFTPHVQESDGYAYGYGWGIEETPRGRVAVHNGSDGIYYAILRRWSGGAVIGWTNGSIAAFREVDDAIRMAILDGSQPEHFAPRVQTAAAPAEIEQFVGSWRLSMGGHLEVTRTGNSLFLQPVGQGALELLSGKRSPPDAPVLHRKANAFLSEVGAAITGAVPLPEGEKATLARRMGEAIRSRTQQLGALEGHVLIGSDFAANGERVTFAQLRFERALYGVELLWEEGEITSARLDIENPGVTPLRPQAASRLAGFSFRYHRPVGIAVGEAEGERTIVIQTPDAIVAATLDRP